MDSYEKLLRLQSADYIRNRQPATKRKRVEVFPLHWHDYFEIEVIVEGSGTYVFNGTPYSVKKGDAYLLTPTDFHEIKGTSTIEIINISFNEEWLSEEMRAVLYRANFSKICKLDSVEFDCFDKAFELLRHECEINGHCIRQLLEYLLSRFVEQPTPTEQEHLTGLLEAVSYMELHFREKITMEQLSALAGYHPTYFSELFRKATGQTYIQRLTDLRINYAKTLLTKGISVSDACFSSGFGSLSNFLSVFKEKCHMTPSAYRKQYK